MRYGILLLTLIILSDSFSLVFAQSMHDFKGKRTNNIFSLGTIDSKKSSIIKRKTKFEKIIKKFKYFKRI